MGFGKGKGFTSRIVVPMTSMDIGTAGAGRTETIMTETMAAGSQGAGRTEAILTETVVLAGGSYP